MKTRLLSAVSAAALSLSLLTGAASSQDLGLQQLQDAATSTMSQLNMDVTMVESLTLEELTQIEAVGATSENTETKVGRIETVLRDAEERIAAGGAVVPSGPAGDVSADDLDSIMVVKENVRTELAQLGLGEDINVDMLSDDQLMQIQLITAGSENEENQRAAIEAVAAN